MIQADLISSILDTLKVPVVFVDTEHVIRYMNRAAVAQYANRGGAGLVGQSLLDCHNEESCRQLAQILAEMREGIDERLIHEDERQRAYMSAVRDAAGGLVGYYERYEPVA